MGKKNLSRRAFLRTSIASGASPAAVGLHAAPVGIYQPGTYSAKASGIGDVVVTMTFDSNKITDVVLDVSHETPNIGQAAAKQLRQSLLKAQSADIDAVSGASITFLRPFTRRPPSASHRPKVKFPLKSSPRPKRPTTATGSVSRPKLRKKTLSIRSRRKFS